MHGFQRPEAAVHEDGRRHEGQAFSFARDARHLLVAYRPLANLLAKSCRAQASVLTHLWATDVLTLFNASLRLIHECSRSCEHRCGPQVLILSTEQHNATAACQQRCRASRTTASSTTWTTATTMRRHPRHRSRSSTPRASRGRAVHEADDDERGQGRQRRADPRGRRARRPRHGREGWC